MKDLVENAIMRGNGVNSTCMLFVKTVVVFVKLDISWSKVHALEVLLTFSSHEHPRYFCAPRFLPQCIYSVYLDS